MSYLPRLNRATTLATVLAVSVLSACADGQRPASTERGTSAQPGELGTVEFSTSCSAEAQPRFLRGVAALHSFWYPVALEEFREATRIDPDCMMGIWGEAMAHNHPIWGDPQETDAARAAIDKIRLTPDLTSRERAWLNAVKVLYGEGDKVARDKAYAAAMERIHREDPHDPEAALFYALALMGTVRPDAAAGMQTRLRAGEIASAVYKKTPDHPGAAHCVIHAYDDPEHARLALDAARRYAEIAPAAPHALHMPSHIFLQLGMWPEAAASNETSWAASDQWVKQRNLSIGERDYHSLHWLTYAYLQQGRDDEAKDLLTEIGESLARFPKDDPRDLMFGTFTQAAMAATALVETERWDEAEALVPAPKGADAEGQAAKVPEQFKAYVVVAQIPAIFARGLALAANRSREAQQNVTALRAIRGKAAGAKEPFVAELVRMTDIQALEIEAMGAAASNEFDEAIRIMRNATALEERTPPPPGPPPAIKPSHELFGEILLRAGRASEAVGQFAVSLDRHPNRARSLLGAARAEAKSGNTTKAAALYAQFARQWQHADSQRPELREAQSYAKQFGSN